MSGFQSQSSRGEPFGQRLLPGGMTNSTSLHNGSAMYQLPDAEPLSIGEFTTASRPTLRERVLYFSLLLLPLLSVLFCIISISTPAIFSLTEHTSNPNKMRVSVGYWKVCMNVASISRTICLAYLDLLSISEEPAFLRASQALSILSVLLPAAASLLFGLLPIGRLREKSRAVLLTGVLLLVLGAGCTIAALVVLIKKGSENTEITPQLEYSGVLAIISLILQFFAVCFASRHACKRTRFNAPC